MQNPSRSSKTTRTDSDIRGKSLKVYDDVMIEIITVTICKLGCQETPAFFNYTDNLTIIHVGIGIFEADLFSF